MTREVILQQIDRLKHKYWTCKDETEAARIENDIDYLYFLLNEKKIMTQEDKQLLLKDLCARLPYGVKVCARFNTGSRYTTNVTAISADRDYIQIRQNVLHSYTGSSVEDIRPYLRPMSSMTEDEKLDYIALGDIKRYTNPQYAYLISEQLDYLNAHHFDYRDLIPMGLALEAPDGMYKTE